MAEPETEYAGDSQNLFTIAAVYNNRGEPVIPPNIVRILVTSASDGRTIYGPADMTPQGAGINAWDIDLPADACPRRRELEFIATVYDASGTIIIDSFPIRARDGRFT